MTWFQSLLFAAAIDPESILTSVKEVKRALGVHAKKFADAWVAHCDLLEKKGQIFWPEALENGDAKVNFQEFFKENF